MYHTKQEKINKTKIFPYGHCQSITNALIFFDAHNKKEERKGQKKKKSTNCFVINLSSGDQDVGNTRCPIVWIKNLNNNIRKKKIK